MNLKTEGSQGEHYYSTHPVSKLRLGIIRAFLCGKYFDFLTGSGVFSKERIDLGTRLLIENMILPEKGNGLDLGCGYGAIGLVAAALRPSLRVFMVDTNQRAVWLARQNADRNNLYNVLIRKGKLYEPVKNTAFHVVLCNPPISAGLEIVERMISEAPQHLVSGGILQMVIRSKICGKRLISSFSESFGNMRISARGSGYRVLLSEKG